MKHTLITAALALGGALTCVAAHADDVYWRVGVSAPIDGYGRVHTVVGNVPPAPVVVAPAPVVVQSYGRPVVYYPPAPSYVVPAWGHRHEWWEHHERWEHRRWDRGDRDEHRWHRDDDDRDRR
jgi:hypothetical protein